MILLVSHFGENRGVTDFFIDFLLEQKRDFYLLKHPLSSARSDYSELCLYSKGTPILVSRYKKTRFHFLNFAKDFYISLLVSFKLNSKVDKVISFGSFNAAPFIFTNSFFGRKIYFWGVDYSRERFTNPLLNKTYRITETVACKYSDFIISQSARQEEARIKFHGLMKQRSIVSSNGIEEKFFKKDFSKYSEPALLYIGSITKQHGIVSFADYFYLEKDLPLELTIIGSGEEEAALGEIIKRSNHPDRIKYLGPRDQREISEFISKADKKLFGIAPYVFDSGAGDHVYYGDSIKIKEYLNYNLPHITHNATYIPEQLKRFGILYDSLSELSESLEDKLRRFHLNIEEKNRALAAYNWKTIFGDIAESLKL